jgi:hypothetical protein
MRTDRFSAQRPQDTNENMKPRLRKALIVAGEEISIVRAGGQAPSWMPLFVAIKGLVTEVGGLMTHGAVIAIGVRRE